MVTKPLNPEQLDDQPEISSPPPPPAEVYEPEPAPDRSGPAWRVLFHLSGSQATTVGLDVWRVTVLGRADPMSAFRPDLDYAPYGAMRHGVSRRHALVKPGERTLYLIDQSSTNGTWVNGQRLLPGREFPLSDGDIIELGALRMTLRIVQSPVETSKSDDSDGRSMRGRRFRWLR